MIVKPSIGFIKTDSDAEFVKTVQKILGMMTGNISYPKAVALLLAKVAS